MGALRLTSERAQNARRHFRGWVCGCSSARQGSRRMMSGRRRGKGIYSRVVDDDGGVSAPSPSALLASPALPQAARPAPFEQPVQQQQAAAAVVLSRPPTTATTTTTAGEPNHAFSGASETEELAANALGGAYTNAVAKFDAAQKAVDDDHAQKLYEQAQKLYEQAAAEQKKAVLELETAKTAVQATMDSSPSCLRRRLRCLQHLRATKARKDVPRSYSKQTANDSYAYPIAFQKFMEAEKKFQEATTPADFEQVQDFYEQVAAEIFAQEAKIAVPKDYNKKKPSPDQDIYLYPAAVKMFDKAEELLRTAKTTAQYNAARQHYEKVATQQRINDQGAKKVAKARTAAERARREAEKAAESIVEGSFRRTTAPPDKERHKAEVAAPSPSEPSSAGNTLAMDIDFWDNYDDIQNFWMSSWWSPDGSTFVTSTMTKLFAVNLQTFAGFCPTKHLTFDDSRFHDVISSPTWTRDAKPNPALVCAYSADCNVRMFDATDMSAWKQKWHRNVDKTMIKDVVFSIDGVWMACCTMDSLKIIATDTGKIQLSLKLEGHERILDTSGWNSTLSVSSKFLVASGGVGTGEANVVKFWRVTDIAASLDSRVDELVHTSTLHVPGGAGPVAFSPDGTLFAVGELGGGEVRVLTVDYDKLPDEWESVCVQPSCDLAQCHCMRLAFSHNGKLLAASWGRATTSVFDLETSACVANFGGAGHNEGQFQGWALAFSPNDSMLAAGGISYPIAFNKLVPIQPTDQFTIQDHKKPEGDEQSQSLIYSNHGLNESVELSDAEQPILAPVEQNLSGGSVGVEQQRPLTATAISSEHVVLVCEKRVVVQWRKTHQELWRENLDEEVSVTGNFDSGIALSNTHVAFILGMSKVQVHSLSSGAEDIFIRLWDESQAKTRELTAIEASPDGTRLAIVDMQAGIAVYDFKTGQLLSRLAGAAGSSCAFYGPCLVVTSFGRAAYAINLNHEVMDLDFDKHCKELSDDPDWAGSTYYPHFNQTGTRLAFVCMQENLCVSMRSGEQGKVISRIAGFGPARGFASDGSSLLLCVPKREKAGWAGSKMSVLDADTGKEVPWSAYLPLVFGSDHIPFFTAGWTTDSVGSPSARILHAVVGAELRLVDTTAFATALEHGALSPAQILELTKAWPKQVSALMERLPHLVNIRDPDTGDTVLHLCAHDGNVAALMCLFENGCAKYTPVRNKSLQEERDGVTALDLAIVRQYHDCAKVLWQNLTPSLNEYSAVCMNDTLALLASKHSTSMLVVPFLTDAACSLERELASFRTTLHEPVACVLPDLTLSQQLAERDADDQVKLWRGEGQEKRQSLPKFDKTDVAPVSSKVVLLPGLVGDPGDDQFKKTFHLLVENCDRQLFDIDMIKMTVAYKWEMNVRKIVLVHLGCYSMTLLVATVAMVLSTQSETEITSDGIDALQMAVIVFEVAGLIKETNRMRRLGLQYLQGRNAIDIATNICLLVAASAHFSEDQSTLQACGSIGVALKWFGRELTNRDLAVFMLIAVVFLLASSCFFLINDADQPAFALNQTAIGPAWPLFTMWRGMLGDFDIEILQNKKSSITMFVIFQAGVVVLMMNLIIAIMGDSYEMVKENETIEARHERAKVIVDMELLWPNGMWFHQEHHYDTYLHILTKKHSGGQSDRLPPWQGITGRVKQETDRMLREVQRSHTSLEKVETMQAQLQAETRSLKTKLEQSQKDMDQKLVELTDLVKGLLPKN